MSEKFERQYDRLGLKAPSSEMDPREKAEIIFYAAAKILGLDPSILPQVHGLPEEFSISPVAIYKLEIITRAIVGTERADYENGRQKKFASWYLMNKPGFRFYGAGYAFASPGSSGGPRLCTFSREDEEFIALECIALRADLMGGKLPE